MDALGYWLDPCWCRKNNSVLYRADGVLDRVSLVVLLWSPAFFFLGLFVKSILVKKGCWDQPAKQTWGLGCGHRQGNRKLVSSKRGNLLISSEQCLIWTSGISMRNLLPKVVPPNTSSSTTLASFLCESSVLESFLEPNMKASVKTNKQNKHKTELVVEKNPSVRSIQTIRDAPTWRQII